MIQEEGKLSNFSFLLLVFVFSLGSLIYILDYSSTSVSLPYIVGDLSVRYEQGTYVMTSFTVGYAIAVPPVNWLIRRLGMIPLYIACFTGFSIVSFFCGITTSFNQLLLGRFILGFLLGPMIPISLAIITRTFSKKQQGVAFGIYTSILVLGPMVGPLVGGFLSYDYSWRWIFYMNVPLGCLCAMILYFLWPCHDQREKTDFDWLGYVFIVIFSSTLQLVIDKGQQWDWFRSDLVLTLLGLSLISLVFFLAWNSFQKEPIFHFAFLKKNSYLLAIILIIFTYSAYFGSIAMLPNWLETKMSYDAITAGLALAPIGIIPTILGPFATYMNHLIGPRILLFISMIIFTIVSFYTTFFYIDIDLYHIQISRLFLGFAFALYIAPLIGLCLLDIEVDNQPKALVLFHYIRNMAGAIGIGAYETLWLRRTVFHRQYLAEFVTPYNPLYVEYHKSLDKLPLQEQSKTALLESVTHHQATILGLDDTFFFMGIVYAISTLIIAGFLIYLWVQKRGRHEPYKLPL